MNFVNSNLNRKPVSLLASIAAAIVIATCLTGCGRGLSGKYTGDSPIGPVTLEIRGGHKAIGSHNGQSRELTYTIDGNRVIFDTGHSKEVYTIQKDGSLSSGSGIMSVTLKKM